MMAGIQARMKVRMQKRTAAAVHARYLWCAAPHGPALRTCSPPIPPGIPRALRPAPGLAPPAVRATDARVSPLHHHPRAHTLALTGPRHLCCHFDGSRAGLRRQCLNCDSRTSLSSSRRSSNGAPIICPRQLPSDHPWHGLSPTPPLSQAVPASRPTPDPSRSRYFDHLEAWWPAGVAGVLLHLLFDLYA